MKKKRYYDIDLARDIVILILPLVHVIEFLGDEFGYADILNETSLSIISPISHFFTIFAAPVFMICMGINMAFTRKNTPKDFIKRGIFLILLEVALNLIRYAIPGLIAIGLTNDFSLQKMILDTLIYGQFNSDILAFAGLCFLLFALFKKLKMNEKHILITTIVLSLISELLVIKVTPIVLSNVSSFSANIIGNFIYLNGDSTFPLIEWLVFPAIGLFFGSKLVKTNNENRLWNKVGSLSIIVVCIYLLVLLILDKDIMININAPLNDSYMNVFITLFEICASFIHLYLFNRIFKFFKLHYKKNVISHIGMLSKNVTYYYCLQWIIVGWIMFLSAGLGMWNIRVLNLPKTILIIISIMFVSSFVASMIRRVRDAYLNR